MRLNLLILVCVLGSLSAISKSAPPSVSSVFGRTGAVTAAAGDYTTSLVPEGTNPYFTAARARSTLAAQLPITYDQGTGIIACPACGNSLTISVQPPLIYNAATGVLSCPTCVVMDASGNVVIAGSLTTGGGQ